MLFTLYVNSLPLANPDYDTYLYADDTAIVVSSNNFTELEDMLNLALENVANYFIENRLSLNCTKSKVMCFGTSPMMAKMPDMNIVHNSMRLEVVHECKYLGVLLDSCLTFTSNTNYIL